MLIRVTYESHVWLLSATRYALFLQSWSCKNTVFDRVLAFSPLLKDYDDAAYLQKIKPLLGGLSSIILYKCDMWSVFSESSQPPWLYAKQKLCSFLFPYDHFMLQASTLNFSVIAIAISISREIHTRAHSQGLSTLPIRLALTVCTRLSGILAFCVCSIS